VRVGVEKRDDRMIRETLLGLQRVAHGHVEGEEHNLCTVMRGAILLRT